MHGTPPDLDRPAFRPLEVQRAEDRGRQGIVLIDRLGLSAPAFLPAKVLPIVGQFDGRRTLAEIGIAASAAMGAEVPEDAVRDLVRQLDERLLLHSGRYRAAVAGARQAFLGLPARPPRHAGSAGYPGEPGRLRAALRRLVPEAPGGAPSPRGLVAPHIDLQRGSQGYAAAYRHLGLCEPADLYVIFGTGHQGPSAPITGLPLDWQTPLGTVPTDRAFLQAVEAEIGAARPDDLFLHRDEHSLEFQVLLLQHLAELRGGGKPFEVVGFLCGALPSGNGDPDGEGYVARIVGALRAAAERSGKRACWIAGADLAHLGPHFGDAEPVGPPLLQRLEQDETARLRHLLDGAPGAFHRSVEGPGNPDRVCSAPALYLTAKLCGGAAELLHYGQAAAADGSQVVSFCSLGFRGDGAA